MTDAYRLLPTEGSDSLARLCADHKVNVGDVWIPLQLLRPTRGKKDTPIPISPSTAIVLVDHNNGGKLIARRSDILSHIPLLCLDEQKLAIPPSAVPDGCTLFVRATRAMSKRRMVEGLSVLHRPITDEQAVAEGSALVAEEPAGSAAKRTRSTAGSDMNAGTVAGGTEAGLERQKKIKKIDELFEEYMCKALEASGKGSATQGSIIMKETMMNLIRVRDAVPLHFITHGKPQTSIRTKGVVWNIPDWRVIYRVFRQKGKEDLTSKTIYTDAARLVAVFKIDNVLIRRESVHTYLQQGSHVWSLVDPEFPSTIHKLAEKGYRIVFLDHYPSLHHGNNITLEAKLNPIAELCQEHFTCDVTVLLSTMSYISASYRRDGVPFLLPYSGLWQFFIIQLNGGLRADADSFFVGESEVNGENVPADVLSWGRRDAQFATNCGLRYMDRDTLKKETL